MVVHEFLLVGCENAKLFLRNAIFTAIFRAVLTAISSNFTPVPDGISEGVF